MAEVMFAGEGSIYPASPHQGDDYDCTKFTDENYNGTPAFGVNSADSDERGDAATEGHATLNKDVRHLAGQPPSLDAMQEAWSWDEEQVFHSGLRNVQVTPEGTLCVFPTSTPRASSLFASFANGIWGNEGRWREVERAAFSVIRDNKSVFATCAGQALASDALFEDPFVLVLACGAAFERDIVVISPSGCNAYLCGELGLGPPASSFPVWLAFDPSTEYFECVRLREQLSGPAQIPHAAYSPALTSKPLAANNVPISKVDPIHLEDVAPAQRTRLEETFSGIYESMLHDPSTHPGWTRVLNGEVLFPDRESARVGLFSAMFGHMNPLLLALLVREQEGIVSTAAEFAEAANYRLNGIITYMKIATANEPGFSDIVKIGHTGRPVTRRRDHIADLVNDTPANGEYKVVKDNPNAYGSLSFTGAVCIPVESTGDEDLYSLALIVAHFSECVLVRWLGCISSTAPPLHQHKFYPSSRFSYNGGNRQQPSSEKPRTMSRLTDTEAKERINHLWNLRFHAQPEWKKKQRHLQMNERDQKARESRMAKELAEEQPADLAGGPSCASTSVPGLTVNKFTRNHLFRLCSTHMLLPSAADGTRGKYRGGTNVTKDQLATLLGIKLPRSESEQRVLLWGECRSRGFTVGGRQGTSIDEMRMMLGNQITDEHVAWREPDPDVPPQRRESTKEKPNDGKQQTSKKQTSKKQTSKKQTSKKQTSKKQTTEGKARSSTQTSIKQYFF